MAAGCVVVASDTAPVREVIDASNGILVPFHRSERLAEALIAALADPDAHAELGSQARRTILERYDMASVCLPQALRILHEPGPASSDAALPGML